MPKASDAMRDRFIRQGMSERLAKTQVAQIHNTRHHDAPVTGRDTRDNRDNRDKTQK